MLPAQSGVVAKFVVAEFLAIRRIRSTRFALTEEVLTGSASAG